MWWIKPRECGVVQHGKRFSPKMQQAVPKRYVRPSIPNGNEAWCLKESEMEIL